MGRGRDLYAPREARICLPLRHAGDSAARHLEHPDLCRTARSCPHHQFAALVAVRIGTRHGDTTAEPLFEGQETGHLADPRLGHMEHAHTRPAGPLCRDDLIKAIAIKVAGDHTHAAGEGRIEREKPHARVGPVAGEDAHLGPIPLAGARDNLDAGPGPHPTGGRPSTRAGTVAVAIQDDAGLVVVRHRIAQRAAHALCRQPCRRGAGHAHQQPQIHRLPRGHHTRVPPPASLAGSPLDAAAGRRDLFHRHHGPVPQRHVVVGGHRTAALVGRRQPHGRQPAFLKGRHWSKPVGRFNGGAELHVDSRRRLGHLHAARHTLGAGAARQRHAGRLRPGRQQRPEGEICAHLKHGVDGPCAAAPDQRRAGPHTGHRHCGRAALATGAGSQPAQRGAPRNDQAGLNVGRVSGADIHRRRSERPHTARHHERRRGDGE